MAKRFSSLVLVVCLALLTGCLEFERQTLTYRYDAKTDKLRIFHSYQGIFGADIESDGPIPAEFSMVCFGAVAFDDRLERTFYGKT